MRLLLLNYEFPPIGGGASSASYHLALEYARNGHDVDVLTSRTSGQPSVERVDGVTIHRVRSLRKGPHDAGLVGALTYLWAAYFKLRVLLKHERYDYAHFFFSVPTGLLSFKWRWTTGKPYVVSLRGSDVPGYDRSSRCIELLHRAILPISRSILEHSEHVVANSNSLRQLAEKSFPNIAISVITNGVSVRTFEPTTILRPKQAAIKALCVSRLIKRKGIDYLLEAIKLAEIPSLTVEIAGLGPERQRLRRLAKALALEDKVEFLGQQSGCALIDLYHNADFLVHTPLTESFSMTLLEAMASGLPIVATNVGGIPELVTPGENGLLFAAGDVEALASALQLICADPALRARFSSANRSKIVREFTWEQIGQQYLQKIYSQPESVPAAPIATLP